MEPQRITETVTKRAVRNEMPSSIKEEDSQSNVLREREEKIDNDQNKDQVDSKTFEATQPGKVVPIREKKTSKDVTTFSESAFSKVWTVARDFHIPVYKEDLRSSFVPNSASFMYMLHIMEDMTASNMELQWRDKTYNSIPVRLYYITIFYLTVLRAKEAAGAITRKEGSWLRNFNRVYRDSSCPIAGPLLPILSNITAVYPEDGQYNYVHPTFTKTGGYTTTKGTGNSTDTTPVITDEYYLLPSIQILGAIARHYCRNFPTDENFIGGHTYVPFSTQKGGNLAGTNFPANFNNNATYSRLLLNPSIMYPFPEDASQMRQTHSFWSRSRLKDFPLRSTTEELAPEGPPELTGLDENLDWFEPCLNAAAAQAPYFGQVYNLSQISPVGGNSTLVECKIKFNDHAVIPTDINWYPSIYDNMSSMFQSMSANLLPDDQIQSSICLTNSELEWKGRDEHPIASRESSLKNGPYWRNEKYINKLEYPERVLVGLRSMIQSHFYISKPNQ